MRSISAVKEIMELVNLLDLLVYQQSVLPAQSVYSNSNSLKGKDYCKECHQDKNTCSAGTKRPILVSEISLVLFKLPQVIHTD